MYVYARYVWLCACVCWYACIYARASRPVLCVGVYVVCIVCVSVQKNIR